ncbi:hypothetical protein [Vagococcus fessus]|uniref:Cation diffusion facilitator family transporter n=1 Tax=Vagococcus fessus TaxID=120370 RepID=A0A430A8I2_9ENTE|nr:hypothetical protein [Vagococcus fessus]RSU03416.1 hypothetical protein CBF31_06805 [Vagococcus fessus]
MDILNDDFFLKVNTVDSYKVEKNLMIEFWDILRDELKGEVIKKFGIGKLLDQLGLGDTTSYNDGGNISTVHNAEQNIFVNEKIKKQYNQAYDRKNYEGRVVRDKKGNITRDSRLNSQRKKEFQKENTLRDGYTGKKLSKDGRTHLDHTKSAKEIHNDKKARLYMSADERNDMATASSNMVYTDGSLNQSKSDKSMAEFINKERKDGKTNAEHYSIDSKKAMKIDKKSRRIMDVKVKTAAAKQVAKASARQGVSVAKREIFGVIMYKFTEIVIDESKVYASKWSDMNTTQNRLDEIKEMGKRVKLRLVDTIKKLPNDLTKTLEASFISGVIGSLVTGLINLFKTTMKKLGRLLQEGIQGMVQGFKLWVTNPDGLDKKTLYKTVLKLIGTSFSVTIGIILSEIVKKNLSNVGIPSFISEIIGDVLGLLVTGVMTALVIFTIDNFGEIMKGIAETIDTFKVGLTVKTSDLLVKYNEALSKVDEVYVCLLTEIRNYYQKMDNLLGLCRNIELLAEGQLSSSAEYAKLSGVSQEKILVTKIDVENYFNS